MPNCPVCGSDKYKETDAKNGFRLLACAGCKSLYAVKISSEQENFSYDDYYDEANLTIPDFVHRRLEEIVGEFASFKQNNRLLDVGCGAGTFMLAAQKCGWEVEGIEVSQPSVEHLRKQNFKVFLGTLDEANFPDDHFDVVVATEVIEHIPDPEPLAREIFRILRPGGLFWGTTPHGRGLSARTLGADWSVVAPPEHLQLFSITGIKNMFKKVGFARCTVATGGLNPFELIEVWRRKKLNKAEAKPAAGEDGGQSFNRVDSSYELNESLTKSPWRKAVKNALNKTLDVTGLGDSIKFWAIK